MTGKHSLWQREHPVLLPDSSLLPSWAPPFREVGPLPQRKWNRGLRLLLSK